MRAGCRIGMIGLAVLVAQPQVVASSEAVAGSVAEADDWYKALVAFARARGGGVSSTQMEVERR